MELQQECAQQCQQQFDSPMVRNEGSFWTISLFCRGDLRSDSASLANANLVLHIDWTFDRSHVHLTKQIEASWSRVKPSVPGNRRCRFEELFRNTATESVTDRVGFKLEPRLCTLPLSSIRLR